MFSFNHRNYLPNVKEEKLELKSADKREDKVEKVFSEKAPFMEPPVMEDLKAKAKKRRMTKMEKEEKEMKQMDKDLREALTEIKVQPSFKFSEIPPPEGAMIGDFDPIMAMGYMGMAMENKKINKKIKTPGISTHAAMMEQKLKRETRKKLTKEDIVSAKAAMEEDVGKMPTHYLAMMRTNHQNAWQNYKQKYYQEHRNEILEKQRKKRAEEKEKLREYEKLIGKVGKGEEKREEKRESNVEVEEKRESKVAPTTEASASSSSS